MDLKDPWWFVSHRGKFSKDVHRRVSHHSKKAARMRVHMKRCPSGADCIGQKECNFQVTLRQNIGKESKKTILKYSQLSSIPVPSLFLS